MSISIEIKKKELGDRFAEVKKVLEQGRTQKEVGAMLGVAQGYYNEVSRGKKLPSIEFVLALGDVLQVSADWYLFGIGSVYRAKELPTWVRAAPSPATLPPSPPHELHKLVEEVLELDDKEITAEVRGLIRGILHGRRKELERQREQEQLKKSA